MIGAIAGDIIGSAYEANPIKTKDFELFHPHSRFTDDSVLSIAVAIAIMEDGDYQRWIRQIGQQYPNAGYGGSFIHWLHTENPEPYNSWGNGAAMRVSPVGWAFDSVGDVLQEAKRTAEISHNHPEGIKGAQAAALAVYLARTEKDKELIRKEISRRFDYDLDRTTADIRQNYSFDVSCQGTVPEATVAFLDSTSWEDAVRNAVSLGGDSDTLACICGAMAEAYYGGVGEVVKERVMGTLPDDLLSITRTFCRAHLPCSC